MQKKPKIKAERQAIVIIHGIGEQKPMSTLRGFVSSLTASIAPPQSNFKTFIKYYNKPDTLSNLFELRRLTVPKKANRPKTDFFEYYWAYNIKEPKVFQVLTWLWEIIFRWPGSMSPRIRGVYYTIWGLLLFIVLFLLWFRFVSGYTFPAWIGLAGPLVWAGISILLVSYVGDAARYTSAKPGNIAERQKIRQEGLMLLKGLHASGLYKNIIIVGHSLGSMIGYDLIKNLWNEYHEIATGASTPEVLENFEKKYAGIKREDFDLIQFRKDQKVLLQCIQKDGNPWLISDFVTLGSPLTHSSFLQASNSAELTQRIDERELPICPPVHENLRENKRITFKRLKSDKRRVLHYGAPFAVTRWTNIYYKRDLVGGPLQDFGMGIENHEINLTNSSLRNAIPFLSHTHYWADSAKHLAMCQQSVSLLKKIIGFEEVRDNIDLSRID